MNNWRETTLGKVANVFTGYPFKSEFYSTDAQDVRLLRGDNISQGAMDWSDARKWPAEQLKDFAEYQLKEDDIVLAMDRPWIGAGLKYSQIIKSDLPALLVQRTARLRGSNDLDIGYLKYVIGSPWFTSYIKRITTGSLVPHISLKQIRDFPVKLPPLEEQKAVAAVLKAVDKKIELNNRINAELEAMAKTLYDYWFVQFDFPADSPQGQGKPYKTSGGKMVYNSTLKREIPAGWEITTVGKISKTELGGTPSTAVDEYWQNADIPWLSSAETASFPIITSEQKITQAGIDNSAATLLPKGTVVISIVRYIRPSILGIDAATNQSVVGIRECKRLKSSFIYPYFCSEVPRLMALRTGAQQPHINKGVIENSPIVIPCDKVLTDYYKVADPIFEKIFNLALQSHELIQLRDWLLPMLMNGQVTVK